MAYWPSSSAIFPTVNSKLPQSVGEIQFFLQHHLGVKGDHFLACVYWYQKHTNYDWYGSSATVCRPVFESDQSYCLIPIQRITLQCIYGKINVSFTAQQAPESVVVATPIHTKH